MDYNAAAHAAMRSVIAHMPRDLSPDSRRVALFAAEIGIGRALACIRSRVEEQKAENTEEHAT